MSLENFDDTEKFIPRDLSWLSFNERVLEEAEDVKNPLLERARFLAIFVNNLDEFFMVRVASLKRLISSEVNKKDKSGLYPQDVLNEVKTKSKELITRLYERYQKNIRKDLENNDIYIKKFHDLKNDQKKYVENYFETTLFPIITPMAVDQGHPFPNLPSKSIAFAVNVRRKESDHLAIIPIPQNVPRLLKLPSTKNDHTFILLEDIIHEFLMNFFHGYTVNSYALFRIIRDGEFGLDEELTPNLLKAIGDEVKKRNVAKSIYMELESSCTPDLKEMLCEGLKFPMEEVVHVESELDLTYLFELVKKVDLPQLLYPGYAPAKIEYEDIFEKIKEGDFLAHMPFQSFFPTIDLIQSAARDENVLAIKMTLYRTTKDSAIVQALQEAAENNKQVTVLMEIKARFDEENNIKWVKELEQAGCHVIYGIPGLKVHSKMALIVRQEEGHIHRYVHLSTGNYNENTARVYTDFGYFTCNEDFAKDVSDIFNVVTGYSMPSPWQRIVSSPHDMRDYFTTLVDREIKFHKKNNNGLIRAKLNSLEDNGIIEKLYEASSEGVKIELLVRGICCLIPGVKGLSENIKVKSIVGRFLEHTRLFIFNNNNNPRTFLASADWMTRNLDRRIEIMFEIYKVEIKEHLIEIMEKYWNDTEKSRILKADRKYYREDSDGKSFNIQDHLVHYYGEEK